MKKFGGWICALALVFGGSGIFFASKSSQANLPYQLSIILDKMTYEAEPEQKNKVDDDQWRIYILYASFRVDGAGFDPQHSTCQIRFLPDPPERDKWDNVVSPGWKGLIGDKLRMDIGGIRVLSTNTAVLPNGGTFPCALNVRPDVIGIAPSALEVGGESTAANYMTMREPPLINDTWMAELAAPAQYKLELIIDGVVIPGNQVAASFEHLPSKSDMHSSNFEGTKWIHHWFKGKEMIKGVARWPAF